MVIFCVNCAIYLRNPYYNIKYDKLLNNGINLLDIENLVCDFILVRKERCREYENQTCNFRERPKLDDLKKSYASVKTAHATTNAKFVSLTNNPISKEKNYAYGGEVEYIIYGGKNSTNKAAAYGSIFAIRLGFNLVYAFTNGEIREGALAIAPPISAATLGVIPAPLIQRL